MPKNILFINCLDKYKEDISAVITNNKQETIYAKNGIYSPTKPSVILNRYEYLYNKIKFSLPVNYKYSLYTTKDDDIIIAKALIHFDKKYNTNLFNEKVNPLKQDNTKMLIVADIISDTNFEIKENLYYATMCFVSENNSKYKNIVTICNKNTFNESKTVIPVNGVKAEKDNTNLLVVLKEDSSDLKPLLFAQAMEQKGHNVLIHSLSDKEITPSWITDKYPIWSKDTVYTNKHIYNIKANCKHLFLFTKGENNKLEKEINMLYSPQNISVIEEYAKNNI